MTDPASQYPTPEEFVERWEALPRPERLDTAERLLTSAEMAADCFMADHRGRLGSLELQRDAVRAALLEHAPLAVQHNSPAEIIRGLRAQRDLQRQRAERAEERTNGLQAALLQRDDQVADIIAAIDDWWQTAEEHGPERPLADAILKIARPA